MGTMGVSSALTNILENRRRKFYLHSFLLMILLFIIEKDPFYQHVFHSF